MGKKHKKHHKSERKEGGDGTPEKPERSCEPPLRLVLKVGPENIMTASPSSDHMSANADSPDTEYRHSHHKKKKKKKRNDHERKRALCEFEQSAPLDTQDDDEEEDEVEGSEEGMEEWCEPSASKKLLLSLHERRANPGRQCKDDTPVPEKRPILKVLENLQKTLQRKDVDGFFAWPVNDIIAPGYSSIILHPMDFSTMKRKIEKQDYSTIDQYKGDFVLMCDNAMKYNRPETVYYKAAKRLLGTGMKVMSKERLATIKRAFGCVDEGEGRSKPKPRSKPTQRVEEQNLSITDAPEFMDTSTMDTMVTDDGSTTNQTEITGKSEDEEDMDEDDAKVLIQEVLEAAKAAKDRLTARKPNSKIGFLRQDKSGTTTLSILNPDRGETEESRKVNLGMLTGRLSHGTASLPPFKEDKRNKALPVSYLMYGPFSSFAPGYDSTFANLSKEESDLLYSTYGDEDAIKYAQSIEEYVKDSGNHVTKLVDNLLDSLTNGEHSKTKQQIIQNKEARTQNHGPSNQVSHASSGPTREINFDYESLKSLEDEGIDMSFLPGLEKDMAAMEKLKCDTEREVDQRLGKTAELIRDLERSQNERLNRKPPAHLQYIQGPSDQEHAIAQQLTHQLKELTAKTFPAHLISTESVRTAMGITVEPIGASSQSGDTESCVLPDDIAKELEEEDTTAQVDAPIRDELIQLLAEQSS